MSYVIDYASVLTLYVVGSIDHLSRKICCPANSRVGRRSLVRKLLSLAGINIIYPALKSSDMWIYISYHTSSKVRLSINAKFTCIFSFKICSADYFTCSGISQGITIRSCLGAFEYVEYLEAFSVRVNMSHMH